MEERYSAKFSNEVIDDLMIRWVCLYIVAREKSGNYNYEDKHKVVREYIDNFYDYDYTQYIIDLKSSSDMNDENELLAIKNCEDILPLAFWRNFRESFYIKRKYFEERLKYHFDKVISIIKKRD